MNFANRRPADWPTEQQLQQGRELLAAVGQYGPEDFSSEAICARVDFDDWRQSLENRNGAENILARLVAWQHARCPITPEQAWEDLTGSLDVYPEK